MHLCTMGILVLILPLVLSNRCVYALRKHLREDHPDYDELSDEDRQIQMNDI